ncbi:MAG: DUF4124 domain-containing protein [Candidatus Binatia bacterium]
MTCGFHPILLALILASLPAVASADILEWTDNAGVTHYTNLKGEVPSHQVVQVVVDEQVWLPQGSALPDAKEEPVVQPEPPRDTEDEVLRAYLAGLESGVAHNISTGGSVYISGPLAVTISPSTPYGSYVLPGYDWVLPGYYPFLTTSVIGRHRGPMRGRFGTGFHGRFPFSQRFITPAGPPPLGAAGPPPLGAAGRPPLRVSGSRFLR